MSVLDDIREQYPTLAFLINDPEVGPLLREAVDPNKGFSPQTFQAKLYQTKWFKSRSTSQRQIDILRNTDPGEYKRQYGSYKTQIKSFAGQIGLKFSNAELSYIAGHALRNGVQPGSPEFNVLMRNFALNAKDNRIGAGSIAGAELTARDIAKGEFYVPLTKKEQRDWGVELALGLKDESAFRQYLSQRSASLYPHLADLLQNGASMEQIFSGHRAIIAEELELSPEQVDFQKDWKSVLHQVDPTSGSPRPMTLHETQTLARKDKRWWGTAKGKEADAGMANFMLKTFGKRA